MFLPIVGFSLALLKLGSLLAWVAVLPLALKQLALLTIVALTAKLVASPFQKARAIATFSPSPPACMCQSIWPFFRLFTSEFVSLMAIFCMAVLLAVKGSPQSGRANLQDGGVSGYAQARPVARVRSFSMG